MAQVWYDDLMIWLVWEYHTLEYFPKIVLDSLIDLQMNCDETWVMKDLILFLDIDLWYEIENDIWNRFCIWMMFIA